MPAEGKRSVPEAAGSPARGGFRSPAAIALFLTLTAAGLATDLLSKHYVFRSFLDDPVLPGKVREFRTGFRMVRGHEATAADVLPGLRRRVCPGVQFTLSTNPGVVFGLRMPRWAVVLASLGAMVFVGLYFATSDSRDHWTHLALALVLAGALGNLYDRIFTEIVVPGFAPIRYEVRDFIDCSELYYKWVFNVADILLVIGVAILVLQRLIPALGSLRPKATK